MAGRGALRGFAAVLALSLLGACVRLIPESGTPAPTPLPPSQPTVTNAMLAGVKRDPSIGSLRLTEATAGPAKVGARSVVAKSGDWGGRRRGIA